ncbi:hypothetical protein Tco_1249445 [Tanacetum coccineum]
MDAPPRPSNSIPLQSHPSLDITLSLSPITPLDHILDTPSPPSPQPPPQPPLMGTDIKKMTKIKTKPSMGSERARENGSKVMLTSHHVRPKLNKTMAHDHALLSLGANQKWLGGEGNIAIHFVKH